MSTEPIWVSSPASSWSVHAARTTRPATDTFLIRASRRDNLCLNVMRALPLVVGERHPVTGGQSHREIIDPPVLIRRRAITDVGRDQELVKLDVRTSAGSKQHVVPIDDERSIEPVLYHAIGYTYAAGDRIRLEVGLDVIPVAFVSRTGAWLEVRLSSL